MRPSEASRCAGCSNAGRRRNTAAVEDRAACAPCSAVVTRSKRSVLAAYVTCIFHERAETIWKPMNGLADDGAAIVAPRKVVDCTTRAVL